VGHWNWCNNSHRKCSHNSCDENGKPTSCWVWGLRAHSNVSCW
jgi:hypothetical protein